MADTTASDWFARDYDEDAQLIADLEEHNTTPQQRREIAAEKLRRTRQAGQ